eukprot:TRINITY_DN9756_c0_g1_i2.p1 TRINITY_DN9756_c0_g1~~TRINITY_DN9756_c0_g1_i2.p1  ORF type:complete len:296 (-),score=31.51 TRINITY_DN9756_c0_g1_i2:133-1020(-)
MKLASEFLEFYGATGELQVCGQYSESARRITSEDVRYIIDAVTAGLPKSTDVTTSQPVSQGVSDCVSHSVAVGGIVAAGSPDCSLRDRVAAAVLSLPDDSSKLDIFRVVRRMTRIRGSRRNRRSRHIRRRAAQDKRPTAPRAPPAVAETRQPTAATPTCDIQPSTPHLSAVPPPESGLVSVVFSHLSADIGAEALRGVAEVVRRALGTLEHVQLDGQPIGLATVDGTEGGATAGKEDGSDLFERSLVCRVARVVSASPRRDAITLSFVGCQLSEPEREFLLRMRAEGTTVMLEGA